MGFNFQNTKSVARHTGFTTVAVNEMARDLGIKMTYRSDLRYWEISNRSEARLFVESLLEC